jgi:hypothetical protein
VGRGIANEELGLVLRFTFGMGAWKKPVNRRVSIGSQWGLNRVSIRGCQRKGESRSEWGLGKSRRAS